MKEASFISIPTIIKLAEVLQVKLSNDLIRKGICKLAQILKDFAA